MREKLAHLLKDSLQIYGMQMLGLLVGLSVSVLVARTLGPEGRGAYGWLMALFTVGFAVAHVGGDVLNRRLPAQNTQLAPLMAANNVVQACVWGNMVAVVGVGVGLLYPVGWEYWVALCLVGLLLPVSVLQSLWGHLLAGLGQIRLLMWSDMLSRVVMLAGVLVCYVSFSLQVWHLVAVQIISALIGLTYGFWCLRKAIPVWPWRVDLSVLANNRGLMVGAFGAGIFWVLFQKVDVLMLGVWRPLAETGYYTVAVTLMDVMVLLPSAIAYVLMSRMAAEGSWEARRKMLLVLLAGVMLVFGVICVVVGYVGTFVIPFVFGADFAESVPAFHRLLWAAWLMAGYHLCQQTLTGAGRARYQMIPPLAGLAVKVGFGWMFISHGMLAAANATIVGMLAAFAVAFYLAMRR